MNRQRGIAQGWLYLVGAVAVLGAITGLVMAWNSYTASLDQRGYDRGVAETKEKYQTRDNEQLQTALARVQTLQNEARVLEAAHVADMEAARSQLEKEKANGKAAVDRVLDGIASGKYRVRAAAFESRACPPVVAGSAKGEAGAAASVGDGAPACKLSAEAERRVLDIGREADDVARQLAAAQAVIVSDRNICNAPLLKRIE